MLNCLPMTMNKTNEHDHGHHSSSHEHGHNTAHERLAAPATLAEQTAAGAVAAAGVASAGVAAGTEDGSDCVTPRPTNGSATQVDAFKGQQPDTPGKQQQQQQQAGELEFRGGREHMCAPRGLKEYTTSSRSGACGMSAQGGMLGRTNVCSCKDAEKKGGGSASTGIAHATCTAPC